MVDVLGGWSFLSMHYCFQNKFPFGYNTLEQLFPKVKTIYLLAELAAF